MPSTTTVPAGRVKYVHVNVNNIRSNAKLLASDRMPVARVQVGNEAIYGDHIEIDGPSTLVYRPDDPLPCGAKVWIETFAAVRVVGVRKWNEKICAVA